MQSPPKRIWFVLPVFWFLLQLPGASAAAHFPTYDEIRPNVAFWIKVYTEYTTRQSIVHDSEDLTIIYDVIDLVPYELPSASKINRRRMKRAKAKYEHILRRLATDTETGDPTYRRVARLFGPGATAKTFRAARARVRCQVGQSDRFKAGLIRSGAYIEKIRDIFRAENLPEALANLPHVESSFDTKAYSKFGAAGIWQFTRSTGKRFMKVGYVLDERRDPLLATHAAASLLKENYQKLNSWPLAITAYNHGAAGMARAKQSYGDYPAIFASYRSRTFKFASRNFYPEFLAACEVAQNYQAYFGDLELDRPARFQVVTLDGYAGFDRLCDHYKVPVHVAQALNPALRSPVFNGQKLVPRGYPFRLPAELDLAAIPAKLYQEVQKPSRFYTVQRGDTAGRIARTQGVKLTDLILANNLDHRARIYPRQTLRIPLPGESLALTPAAAPSKPQEPELLAKNEIPTTFAHEPLTRPVADVLTASASAGSESAPDTIPAAEESANAGNEIPPNADIADAGSELQPDNDIANAGSELPPNEDTADAGDKMPPNADFADAGSELQPDNDIADAGSELPPNEDTANAGDKMPPNTDFADAGSELQPDKDIADAGSELQPSENTADAGDEMPPNTDFANAGSELQPDNDIADTGSELQPNEDMADAGDEMPPSMEVVSADVSFEKVIDNARRPMGIIRAEVEETLGHYAEWAGVRTQQIRRLNGLPFGGTLHLHQKIKIPLTRTTARKFEESRYEYHKRLQEDFFSAYRISDLNPYRVMRGDNLWSLCLDKFDIPMWLLKNCNPEVDFAALHLQQKLLVPTIEKSSGETSADPESDQVQTAAVPVRRASL